MSFEVLRRHRETIAAIVSGHGGANPRVFGSVARGEADFDSDVDLLIDLEPDTTLFDLAHMRCALETLLDVAVDVVASNGLEGPTASAVLAEARPL